MDDTVSKSGFPELDYIYGEESKYYSFINVPKELVSGRYKSLSAKAQILYIKMLDRLALSIKNGWCDKRGRTYIYYTLEAVMEALNCGHNTATKVLRELDTGTGAGLIERVKQGQGKPTRIYVKSIARLKKDALENRVDVSELAYGAVSQDMQKGAVSEKPVPEYLNGYEHDLEEEYGASETIENKGFPRYAKSGSQDCTKEAVQTADKGQRVNNNINNIKFNDDNYDLGLPEKIPYEQDLCINNKLGSSPDESGPDEPDSGGFFPFVDMLEDDEDVNETEHDPLPEENLANEDVFNLVTDVVEEVKDSKEEFYVIHKQKIDTSLVKERFKDINKDVAWTVAKRVEEQQHKGRIKCMKAYILSALYNEAQSRHSQQAMLESGNRGNTDCNPEKYHIRDTIDSS